jgi:hypothetical protein
VDVRSWSWPQVLGAVVAWPVVVLIATAAYCRFAPWPRLPPRVYVYDVITWRDHLPTLAWWAATVAPPVLLVALRLWGRR